MVAGVWHNVQPSAFLPPCRAHGGVHSQVDDPLLRYKQLNAFDMAMQTTEARFPWLSSKVRRRPRCACVLGSHEPACPLLSTRRNRTCR